MIRRVALSCRPNSTTSGLLRVLLTVMVLGAVVTPNLFVGRTVLGATHLGKSAITAPTVLPPVAAHDSRFGVVQAFEAPTQATQAGVAWERLLFRWNVMQPNGPQNFQSDFESDAQIAAEKAAGRQIVGVVLGTPSWAARDRQNGVASVPANLSAPLNDPSNYWAQFVSKLVTHYKGSISAWIIWNEPDRWNSRAHYNWAGTPAEYYQLLKVAYQVAKSIDPSITILAAGQTFSWDKENGRPQFLDGVLAAADADPTARANNDYFDAADVHMYSDPLNAYLGPLFYKQLMAKHGLNKPMWMDEMNVVPSDDPASSIGAAPWTATQDQQASYMIEAISLALAANVSRFAVYKMKDGAAEGAGELYGLVRNDGTPRSEYVAYQLAAREFGGTTSATYLWGRDGSQAPTAAQLNDLLNSNLSRYQWIWPAAVNRVVMTRGNTQITVLWNESDAPAVGLVPATGGSVMVLDKQGQTLPTPTQVNGRYAFTLTPSTNNSDPRDATLYLVGGDPVIVEQQIMPFAVPTDVTTINGNSDTDLPNTPTQGASRAKDPAGSIYIDLTKHNIRGPFLHYFQSHGGVDRLGYPRTEILNEQGKIVQYFDRAVLTLSSDGQTVTALPLGRMLAPGGTAFAPVSLPVATTGTVLYSATTHHTLSGAFLDYWLSHNGQSWLGYPISEQLSVPLTTTVSSNGIFTTTVSTTRAQYFANYRLELHTDILGAHQIVILSTLGDDLLRQKGWLPGSSNQKRVIVR